MKLPLIFAHRGANTFAPENSLSAFEKALELGCDGIECDVRFTADEKIVIFHDRNTYRLTGSKHHIQKSSLWEIRQLRLHWNNSPIENIPTFEEVLDLVRDKSFIIIDIKKENISRNRFEENLIKTLEIFHLKENIIFSSFNPFVLKKIASVNPNFHLGFIFRNRSSMMMLNGHPVRSLHARGKILSRTYLNHLRSRTKSIFAWTIDKQEEMLQLISKNVDGIISNRPELFMELKDQIINSKKTFLNHHT